MATGVDPPKANRCHDEGEEFQQEQPPVRPQGVIRQPHRGGYECEFVERPPKAFQSECPVCLLVLREPHQLTCCGYSFCATCIKCVQEEQKCCPICSVATFNVFANKGLKRTLNEYRVYCCQRGEGCEWVGELGELDRHLNLQPPPEKLLVGCQFSEVDCTYCVQPFQRCHVQAHQSDDCPKRPYACPHCNKYAATFKATFEEVTQNHWPVCPFFPLSCPNNCDLELVLKRQEVEHHVSRDCPVMVAECNFHVVGCEVQLARRDIPSHISENLTEHMSLLQVHMMTHPGENMATYLLLMVGSIQKIILDNAHIRSELQEAQNVLREILQSHGQLQTVHDKLGRAQEEPRQAHDEQSDSHETVPQLEATSTFQDRTNTKELEEGKKKTAGLKASGTIQQEQNNNLQGASDTSKEASETLQQQEDSINKSLTTSEQKAQSQDTLLAAANEVTKQHRKLEDCCDQLEQHKQSTKQAHKDLHKKIEQAYTQLQARVTALSETASDLDQHKRESDEKLRTAKDELSRKFSRMKIGMLIVFVFVCAYLVQRALNTHHEQQMLELTQILSASEQKIQSQIDELRQSSTQLQAVVTEHQEEITATFKQHEIESDEKLRAAKDELLKKLTASEHRMQRALNTQQATLTQQGNELTEKLSASEQKMQSQVDELSQNNTQLQAAVTAHKEEITSTFNKHKDKSNQKLSAATNELSKNITASEHRIQTALNTQKATLTQQKHELTEKLSASEQKLQATLDTQQTIITKCREENRRLQQALTAHIHRRYLISTQAIEPHVSSTPIEFTLSHFEWRKKWNQTWDSKAFYTHPQGYRMCLRVHPNGTGDGLGTHVSIFIYILRGPFDGGLKWPFRGDVTIQIMNHAREGNHLKEVIPYTYRTPDASASRVTKEERSNGWGIPMFLPHSSLGYNAARNTHYLRGDSLQIQISEVTVKN